MMRKDKIYVNVLLPQTSCAEVISCLEERNKKSDMQAHHAGELPEDAWKEFSDSGTKTVLTSYCNSLLESWNPQAKAAIELVKHLVMFAIFTKSDAEKASLQLLCTMLTHKSRSRMCLESPDFLPNAHTRLKATHTQRKHEDRMRANHMLHCFCTCSLFISRPLEGSLA